MSDEGKKSKLDELELAFCFAEPSGEYGIYISKLTGEIVHDAEMITGEPCPVEDIEWNDDYLPLPDKQ